MAYIWKIEYKQTKISLDLYFVYYQHTALRSIRNAMIQDVNPLISFHLELGGRMWNPLPDKSFAVFSILFNTTEYGAIKQVAEPLNFSGPHPGSSWSQSFHIIFKLLIPRKSFIRQRSWDEEVHHLVYNHLVIFLGSKYLNKEINRSILDRWILMPQLKEQGRIHGITCA